MGTSPEENAEETIEYVSRPDDEKNDWVDIDQTRKQSISISGNQPQRESEMPSFEKTAGYAPSAVVREIMGALKPIVAPRPRAMGSLGLNGRRIRHHARVT